MKSNQLPVTEARARRGGPGLVCLLMIFSQLSLMTGSYASEDAMTSGNQEESPTLSSDASADQPLPDNCYPKHVDHRAMEATTPLPVLTRCTLYRLIDNLPRIAPLPGV